MTFSTFPRMGKFVGYTDNLNIHADFELLE